MNRNPLPRSNSVTDKIHRKKKHTVRKSFVSICEKNYVYRGIRVVYIRVSRRSFGRTLLGNGRPGTLFYGRSGTPIDNFRNRVLIRMDRNEGLNGNGTKSFLILGVFVVSLVVPVNGFATSGETLTVQHVDTPVKYRPADRTRWQDLSGTSAQLSESGDFLVEEDGAVELRTDDSEVNLNEKSGLSYRLSADTADELRLNHGSMRTEVDSGTKPEGTKLKLETPMGSLGIRGTEFGVSFERSGRSEVYVDTGRVVLNTDRDRTRVSEEEYVAFGQRGVDSTRRILDRGGLPDRYRITWNRWSLRRRIAQLERKREELRSQIRRDDSLSDRKKSPLRDNLERVEERLAELREDYQPLNERYESYRKRLEKKRGDFIRKRKQAFDEYRRRRMREMREMQRQRERGIEEMLRRQQEGMENMR